MTDAPGANEPQATYWEDRSSSWIAAEQWTSMVTGPFGQLAIERLAPQPGESVLDVGCGSGPTTIELARRVDPGGTVLGVDIAPSMIDAARLRADRAELDGLTFRVADAQADDLGPVEFDGVFSQFGVMFFSDPAAAFANLHRSLRPGGRLAFACWQDILVNEWMFLPGSAVVIVTGELPPMPGPGEPGPMSLADPEHIGDLLADAGFQAIEVVQHDHVVVVEEARVDEVVEASSRVGAVREAFEANDDPAFRDRLLDTVRQVLHDRVEDGELRLAAAAHIVSATA